ncbi:MAG: flagellar biosynthetic protein FliO [Parvularculaceae bacterium]
MTLLEIARLIFALIAVLGLIGLAAVAAKRLGLAGANGFQRARRLQLVETLALDQRRRAAILKCDGREHLIVLDNGRVTIVEAAIPAIETTPAIRPSATVSRLFERALPHANDGAAALRAVGAL